MMRTPLRFTAASIAAATLVAVAAGASAEPINSEPASATAVAAPTGSSAVDAGVSSLESIGTLAQRGDAIGVLIILAGTPFVVLTSGVCDVITAVGFRSPCTKSTK